MWYVYVLSKTGRLQHYSPEDVIVRITPASAHGTLFILPFTVGQVAQVDKPSTDQTPPDLYSVVFSLLIPTGIITKKKYI